MTRIHAAVALATALVALFPPVLRAAEDHRPQIAEQWGQINDLHELVSVLDAWLDRNSEWSRRDTAPRIRMVSEAEARARQGATGVFSVDVSAVFTTPSTPRSCWSGHGIGTMSRM